MTANTEERNLEAWPSMQAKPRHTRCPCSHLLLLPAATYFTDKKLYAFDCIFLIYDGSFLESCKQILDEAHAWGKPVAFLRTKADRLLDDVMYNNGIDDEQIAKQHLHLQIQDAFQCKVVAPYGPHHLFLISARQLRLARFDEVAFFEYIRHAAARREST